MNMNRREFLRHATVAAVATCAAPGVGAWAETPAATAGAGAAVTDLAATAVRAIGKTGLHGTFLGMGTGVRSWNHESDLTRKGRDAYMAVLERAYERGLRYFDMADMYGAHPYMHDALKSFIDRDKTLLLTKTNSREAAGVRDDLERFRRDLDTDHLDIVLLHCMTEADWPTRYVPVLDAMADAKAKGIVKAHGVSCHSLEALKAAAQSDWVDVILARVNPFGVKMDASPDEVVPVLKQAHAAGKGVIGMKIAGEGELVARLDESLRFAVGLGCLDAVAIGFLAPGEVDDTMARIAAAAKAVAAA